MLNLQLLLALVGAGLVAYYLIQGLKLKENALRAVETYCQRAQVQLLDGSIALRRLGVARTRRGSLALTREYRFEFTATGADRNAGFIKLLGTHIVAVELSPHRF